MHRELRNIHEGILGDSGQNRLVVHDFLLVEFGLLLENGLFRRLQENIDAAKHHHRENDLLVIHLFKDIHQHVVGDIPHKTDQLVELLRVIHKGLIC